MQDPDIAISEDDKEAEPQQLDVQLPEVQLALAALARLPSPELLQQTSLCQALSRWRTAVRLLILGACGPDQSAAAEAPAAAKGLLLPKSCASATCGTHLARRGLRPLTLLSQASHRWALSVCRPQLLAAVCGTDQAQFTPVQA